MKKLFAWISSIFLPEKDMDNVIKYVDKMEKGEHLTAEEKERILKSAIKISKEQKEESDRH